MNQDKNNYWWIKELSKANDDAYRIFFDQYYRLFTTFTYNYVKDINIAEDIVHDVIYEILKKKLDFTNIDSFKSFMFTSIKNRSINHLRHISAGEKYKRITLEEESSDFFTENIIEQEVYYYLRCAINELTPNTTEIYKLTINGLSNKEISKKMLISLDSVKSHKKRGRKILAEKLKKLLFIKTN